MDPMAKNSITERVIFTGICEPERERDQDVAEREPRHVSGTADWRRTGLTQWTARNQALSQTR